MVKTDTGLNFIKTAIPIRDEDGNLALWWILSGRSASPQNGEPNGRAQANFPSMILVKVSANGFYPFGKIAAQSSSNVLIEGESGMVRNCSLKPFTTQQLLRRAFVAINCAALPRTHRKQLFGYEGPSPVLRGSR